MYSDFFPNPNTLCERESDGLFVALVFCKQTDVLGVQVVNTTTLDMVWIGSSDEGFPGGFPRAKALDAFDHPFAYMSDCAADKVNGLVAA